MPKKGESKKQRVAEQIIGPLEHAGISLDPATQQVRYQAEEVIVTPMEYQLLHQLMVRPGKVVTRERLSRALYGWVAGSRRMPA